MTRNAPAQACRPLAAGFIAVIVAMAGACARTVVVEGSSPAPLVAPVPLSIGVFYGPEFRKATHRVDRPRERPFDVKYGAANVAQFDEVFGSLFERAVPLEEMPATGSSVPGIDAILEPRIEEYAALTPDDSGQSYYAASIKYRIHLFAADGTFIASWPINAYGKSQWSAFRDKRTLREASKLAIRDAAAALALGFAEQEQVKAWMRNQAILRAQGN